MEELWYTSIPRLITIMVAVSLVLIALYGLLFYPLVRRFRKEEQMVNYESERQTILPYGERRIYPRSSLDMGIRYRPYGKEGQIQIFREGRTGNISEGGVHLEAGELLTVDSRVELKLKLPATARFILVRGKIIWVKELVADKWYGYGVSFTEIDPNDRKLIAKYVAEKR